MQKVNQGNVLFSHQFYIAYGPPGIFFSPNCAPNIKAPNSNKVDVKIDMKRKA